jgi:hypothetical protein
MGVSVHYVAELNLVESVFDVSYTKQDIIDSTMEAIKLAAENGTDRYLVDCTKLARSRSIIDIYSIGELYNDLDIKRGSKQAVILSSNKEIEKNTRFYETATRNRGYDVRIFNDHAEAVAWLQHD